MLQAELPPYELSTPRQGNDLADMVQAIPAVLVQTNLALVWVVLAFAMAAAFMLLSLH
jgi:hypothetical protein